MQKLRTCFLATIFTAASIGSALAQEPAEMNEPPTPRREIGFGTNIILGQIFDSGSAPLDLMYRWGNDQRLYRLGTSLAYYTNNRKFNNLEDSEKRSSFWTTWFVGREWRTEVAKRWQVNYGGDLTFNLNNHNTYSERTYDDGQGGDRLCVTENQAFRIGGGLRPFIGILFKINERLLLGTEASLLAGVQNAKFSSERYSLVNGGVVEDSSDHDREDSEWQFNIRTQPASNIFVYYRF